MRVNRYFGWLLCTAILTFPLGLKAEGGSVLNRTWNPFLIMQRPVPQGEFQQIDLPIKRAGNLMLIEAKVDGVLGYFILDTGAPYLVLNQTYFRNFKLEAGQEISDVSGLAGAQQVTTVEKLEIRDLYYEDVLADVFDLSTIENKRGVKILGLMGVNLWLQLELEFDLNRSQLTVFNLSRKGERLSVESSPEAAVRLGEFDFLMRNNVLLLKSKVKDETLMLCFDTGSETVVLNNRLDKEVYAHVEITNRKPLVAAGGQGLEVLYGKLNNLDVGCPIKQSNVIIANLAAIGKSYGIDIDGIIGYDLLKQGKVSVNFRKKVITVRAFS